MSNGLEKYQPAEIADLDQWAEKLYGSGMFQDATSVAQAFVKIAAGAELGLSPFQSMSGVHLIKGKPVVGAGLLASLLDRDPDYDYAVAWEPDESNPEACTISVLKNGKERGKSRFSLEDAKRAGILRDNWLKYPSAMLFARAMSQAVRWYAPGATGTSVYVEGELTHDVEAIIPDGVTAKPRTRVTAEVVREPEVVVKPAEVEFDDDPVTLQSVGKQLTALSRQERVDLYGYCGVTTKLTPADAHALFTAKADEFGLPESDPPDIRAILDRCRVLRMRETMTADGVEEFERFAKTGEDLDAGDQATLDAEALA